MTRDELHDRGTRICERLSREVAEVAPDDIGGWERVWDIVAAPDASFMVALDAWEAEPTGDTKVGLKAAYKAVLDAWRRAATEFENQRRVV